VHPYVVHSSVDRTSVKLLLRDTSARCEACGAAYALAGGTLAEA